MVELWHEQTVSRLWLCLYGYIICYLKLNKTNGTNLPSLLERLGSTNMDFHTNSALVLHEAVRKKRVFELLPRKLKSILENETRNLVIMKFGSNVTSYCCLNKNLKNDYGEVLLYKASSNSNTRSTCC